MNEDKSSYISGTTYRIWNDNGYDKNFVTNENGEIKVEGLALGKYYYKETQASTGYLIDSNTYSFELNYKDQYTEVVYADSTKTNIEPTGTITLKKVDSETGTTPQGDATLKGAKYELFADEDIYNVAKTKKYYSKGDLVATRTTDEKGETAPIEKLPLGKFKLKESVSSNGYLLDKTEYSINLQYKDQNTSVITSSVTSKEQVKKMQVHFFKSGIKVQSGLVDGLQGAEFTIKLASDVEKALSKGYSYEEIWSGIDNAGNKVSVNTARVNEAQVIAPTYEVIVTDENGNAYTNKLPYGKFVGKETSTPKDFETAGDFYFSINQDESEISETANKVKDLFINNEQLETYIKIVKKDLKTNKIVITSSATFEIKATEDIYDRGNNKILYKKGDKITQKIGSTTYTSFTTNSNNIIVPTNSYNSKDDEIGTTTTPLLLPVGSYEISEISTPTGFLILEKPVTFKVDGIRNYDTDADGDYIKTINVYNEQPTGTLIIDKSIITIDDVDTSLIDTSDYSKIQFVLRAKKDILDKADNSVIYSAGTEIGVYNLNKNGDLKVENLPMGSYELQEKTTLDGLILDNNIYEIEFVQEDLTTKVYEKTLELENYTTLFEFSKTDITGDKELKGATLRVEDKDGNVIDSWVSSDKTHKIEGLIVDKEYSLIEEIAPDNFVKATEIKFKVLSTTEIQKVTMIDKIVEISKKDVAGEEIEGATLQVIDKDGNVVDEWVSEKETHKVKGLIEGESYILHEEVTAEEYVKATDIEFKVTFDKENQYFEMIDKIVEISKKDVAGEEIEGATLQVIDKDGKVVDEWISGKEAHKVKGLEENKEYILHEEVVIDGYVKATDIEFLVTTDKETQKEEMIDKIVEISKKDVAGEEIEGATLQVIDKDGNIVDEWVSEKETHKVKGLIEGENYILHEEVTAENFVKATDIEFNVTFDKENQYIEMIDKMVTISKVDLTTGEEIEGANLRIEDEDGNVIDSWVSSKTPHIVNGLEENKNYKLIEETAPYGYLIAETIEFNVSEDKATQEIVMKDMPILKTIRLTKIDEETKEIIKEKFTFGLYANKECTELVQQMDSDKENGTITFEDIRYGTWYVKELSAPNGYVKSDKVLKVEINDDGVFVEDVEIQENDSIYNFEFSNKKIETPKTGDSRPIMLAALIIIISLIGIIILGVLKFKKRK